MLQPSDIQQFIEKGKQYQRNGRRAWLIPFLVWLVLSVLLVSIQLIVPAEPDMNRPGAEGELIFTGGVLDVAYEPSGDMWIIDAREEIHRLTERGVTYIDADNYASNGDSPPLRAIVASDDEVFVALDDYLLLRENNEWYTVNYGVKPPGTVIKMAFDENYYRLYSLDDTGVFTGINGSFPIHELVGLPEPVTTYDMTHTPYSGIWLTADNTLWHYYDGFWSQVHEFATDGAYFIGQTASHVWVKTEANRTLTAVPIDTSQPVVTQSFGEIGLPADVEIGRLHQIDDSAYLATTAGVFRQELTMQSGWYPVDINYMLEWNIAVYAYLPVPDVDGVVLHTHDRRAYGDIYIREPLTDRIWSISFLIMLVVLPGGAVFVMRRLSGVSKERKNALVKQLTELFLQGDPDSKEKKKNSAPGKKGPGYYVRYVFMMVAGVIIIYYFVLRIVLAALWLRHQDFLLSTVENSPFLFLLLCYYVLVFARPIARLADGDKSLSERAHLRRFGMDLIFCLLFVVMVIVPVLLVELFAFDLFLKGLLQITLTITGSYLAGNIKNSIASYLYQNKIYKVATTAPDGQTPEMREDYFPHVMMLQEENQLDEAAERVREFLITSRDQLSPQDASVSVVLLGKIIEIKGDLKSAYRYYTIGLAMAPDHKAGYVALAEFYLQRGNPAVALACADHARELSRKDQSELLISRPQKQLAYYTDALYAAALAANGQHEPTRALIQKALLEADKECRFIYAGILNLASYVMLKQNQPKKAAKYLKYTVQRYQPGQRWPLVRWIARQLR